MKTRGELHVGRLLLLVAIVGVSVWAWDFPALLPFKLLAVMGHETGHALASLVTGGSVDSVSLKADESGNCLSRIPDSFFARVLVSSAGYVGSALISVVLLLLTYRFDARRKMLGAACAWLVVMGLFYARDGFTLLFCVVMAAAFGVAAKWLPDALVGATNLFIASFTALYAVLDLKDDLWNRAVRAHSDAQILADATFVPAIAWAALWTALSVGILGVGGWLALKGNGRRADPLGARLRSL